MSSTKEDAHEGENGDNETRDHSKECTQRVFSYLWDDVSPERMMVVFMLFRYSYRLGHITPHA